MVNGETETTCGSLLRELQHIWDEVGESDAERDQMLLQLEQECLQVYRRKVDLASNARVRLQKALADSEAELTSLISRLGDRSFLGRSEKQVGTLKEQLSAVQPQLDELRQKLDERMRQFIDVKARIEQITAEILGLLPNESNTYSPATEEDLSLKRLDEYHSQLQALQKEKSERLHKVLDYVGTVHELCAVLGMDFFKTVTEVHPSLDDSTSGQSKSISNETLEKLAKTVTSLKQEKKQRIKKLQDLGTSLIEMWSLMDTPREEQLLFQHVTCILSMAEDEVCAPRALALDNIEQAEVEVERLDTLKASKTKELVIKKQEELDDIYRQAHMDADPNTTHEKIMAVIDSGLFDPSELLASMDLQICKAKEEALSRREIMEKVEKWMSACEEESWLEDYSRDQNRYNATRGAHLNLKRAERARVTVNKLPVLVDSLVAKTQSWEEEHGFSFVYDGVRLLDMLEEYSLLRQEKEEEKRRARDHKKLQEQLITEQETFFGSRPSPNKPLSAKKSVGARMNGSVDMSVNRRLSLASGMMQSSNTDTLVPRVNGVTPVHVGKDGKREKTRPAAPANFVALTKEDSISVPSVNGSDPASPIAA
ncbi:hypothetical protein L7F22_042702 [Adiantum nelumboides]|nr:hypothetical protein [Adiantum nelumboides]